MSPSLQIKQMQVYTCITEKRKFNIKHEFIHKTLRVTPAMEAGISDYVWSLEDIAQWQIQTKAPPCQFLLQPRHHPTRPNRQHHLTR